MASSSSSSDETQKNICNYDIPTICSKTKSEMYVDWDTTNDDESREIPRLLENRGLKGF